MFAQCVCVCVFTFKANSLYLMHASALCRKTRSGSQQPASPLETSEPADRHSCSACNLKKGIVSLVAWLWLKDGVLRSHFALKTGSQINRSLSVELFCSKSIRSSMTLSLISLLYKDIAELWLLLKKSTGVSSFSNLVSCLGKNSRQTISSYWGKWMCFSIKAEVVLFLCTFVYNLL